MDRRGFFTAAGIVAVAATSAEAVRATEATPANPTSRTAAPSGSTLPYEVRVVYRTAPAESLIALTFDDGPTATWTPQVLDLLARHQARATFFVVGERLAAAPQLAQAAVRAGHQIGTHTWAHSNLKTHSERFIGDSLRRTHQLIADVTGRAPTSLRPPWGQIDAVGLLVCAELQYDVILWSEHVTGSNAFADAATTTREARPGSIVLAHDGGPEPNRNLMRALDQLLASLRAKGYRFVTVSELLAASIPFPR
ncbi:MAG: polysaccharide deacetylase family protein [Actinomycetes bacterium]